MDNLLLILKNFSNKKVAVIGDVMLDENWFGDVSRISPEAPVPILKVKEKAFEPGGAANVAANISTLGGQVSLFGFIGNDTAGGILKNLLEQRKINYFLDISKITTHKLRGKAKNQQISRLDCEETSPKNFSREILEIMHKEISNSDIILVSDYAKGTVTKVLMEFLSSLGKKIIVDPKPENIDFYKNIFLITPNEKEALEMSGEKNIADAAKFLKQKLNCNIIATRGEKGMYLLSEKELETSKSLTTKGDFDSLQEPMVLEIPTYAKEVYDVTGAGDTAISAIAMALASNSSLEEAAIIANHAAGIKVGKAGTYNVRLKELEQEISGEEKKVYYSLEELSVIISDLRIKGKKIVWTNGCFDLLHEGHVRYLKKAADYGDFLIVGLNSDDSVRRIKGPSRPIRNQEARAEIISSLGFIDAVIIFSEDDTTSYLNALKPDIYVKGGDYAVETINQPERLAVESYGGQIAIVPQDVDISTTKILEKLKDIN